MHEILVKPGEAPLEPGEKFKINTLYGEYVVNPDGELMQIQGELLRQSEVIEANGFAYRRAINNGIVRKPRPGCWHCRNIEAHKIEYVTAVKDKDGRPMNTPTDIPYRYCPSCGRKLEADKMTESIGSEPEKVPEHDTFFRHDGENVWEG